MFTVTTVNLSSATGTADSSLGPSELGVLTPDEFLALLHRLRQIDSAQNNDADPHLLVTAASGRFIIRTGQGKLFLYNARDTTEPYSQLSPEKIVTQLDPQRTHTPFTFTASTAPAQPKATPRYAIAFAILITGLALNGYTIYSVFYAQSVHEIPPVVVLTDAAELATLHREAIGSYATGNQPGDRVITVTPEGKIRFFELGTKDGLSINTDSFRLGRHDKRFCLLTSESGVVDFVNPDTLLYYRDTYRRSK